MKYDFKPGDIVALKETEDTIGYWNVSLMWKKAAEQFRAKKRQWRGEIVRILKQCDKDGDPIAQIRRLDTKGHGLETSSQAFLAHSSTQSEVTK